MKYGHMEGSGLPTISPTFECLKFCILSFVLADCLWDDDHCFWESEPEPEPEPFFPGKTAECNESPPPLEKCSDAFVVISYYDTKTGTCQEMDDTCYSDRLLNRFNNMDECESTCLNDTDSDSDDAN